MHEQKSNVFQLNNKEIIFILITWNISVNCRLASYNSKYWRICLKKQQCETVSASLNTTQPILWRNRGWSYSLLCHLFTVVCCLITAEQICNHKQQQLSARSTFITKKRRGRCDITFYSRCHYNVSSLYRKMCFSIKSISLYCAHSSIKGLKVRL